MKNASKIYATIAAALALFIVLLIVYGNITLDANVWYALTATGALVAMYFAVISIVEAARGIDDSHMKSK